jgi:hypothetical protein
LSFETLVVNIRSALADVAYLRQRVLNLKDWPGVKLNPSLIVFLSLLLYLLDTSERELKEAIAVEGGKQAYSNTTIKQKVDFHDVLISTVEGLVLLVDHSLEIPQEITVLVSDALSIFSEKADFVLLAWPYLATSTLGDIVPLNLLPPHVCSYLERNTFAVIWIPYKIAKNPEYWPRIVHEVAHNVDRISGLTNQLLSKHQQTIANVRLRVARSIKSLCQEKIADLLSARVYGPSYAHSALMVFLRGEPTLYPTHPMGTKRLRDIADELRNLGFGDSAASLEQALKELQETKVEDVVREMDLGTPLEDDLKSVVYQFCLERKVGITPEIVSAIELRMKDHLLFDPGTGSFSKLTPCATEVRLVFALANRFAAMNSGYEPELLHGWIRDSVRLSPAAGPSFPEKFYLPQPAHT